MEITVQKLSDEELRSRGVFQWPIWEKDVSHFEWHYDSTEECYIIEGQASVEVEGGKRVSFGKGDFITFPKGLKVTWEIKRGIRKHYAFR